MNWERQIKLKTDEAWNKIHDKEIQSLQQNNFMFNYRAEHTELAFSIGIGLGKKLNADMEILRAALLLHDIGRSVVEKGHGKIGAQMAGDILHNTNFPQEKINQVKYAIRYHVGWDESVPETLEACILRDADNLAKLGATIILQKSMRLPLMGKNSWDAVTEFNNWLKKAEYIKNHMKTKLGSKMAEERFKTLHLFVTALNKEITT